MEERESVCISGEELIATAGALAFGITKCMDDKELTDLCELLGLLKHNIEIIKFRRYLCGKRKID